MVEDTRVGYAPIGAGVELPDGIRLVATIDNVDKAANAIASVRVDISEENRVAEDSIGFERRKVGQILVHWFGSHDSHSAAEIGVTSNLDHINDSVDGERSPWLG